MCVYINIYIYIYIYIYMIPEGCMPKGGWSTDGESDSDDEDPPNKQPFGKHDY